MSTYFSTCQGACAFAETKAHSRTTLDHVMRKCDLVRKCDSSSDLSRKKNLSQNLTYQYSKSCFFVNPPSFNSAKTEQTSFPNLL